MDNSINENRQRRQYSNSGSNSGIDYTYWNSAIKKANSENWDGAKRDMSTFIGQYPNVKEAWENRAAFKIYLDDLDSACYDLKRAAELGSEQALESMLKLCNNKPQKTSGNNSAEEIAKKFDSNRELAIEYYNSGMAKGKSKDYQGAIGEFTKAIELNPDYDSAYRRRGELKRILKDDK